MKVSLLRTLLSILKSDCLALLILPFHQGSPRAGPGLVPDLHLSWDTGDVYSDVMTRLYSGSVDCAKANRFFGSGPAPTLAHD